MCSVILLTPEGRGAIATLIIDGARSLAIVEQFFFAAAEKPLDRFPLNRAVYGRWNTLDDTDDTAKKNPGEELVVCRRSETRIEIHCHGGRTAAERIQQGLMDVGCRNMHWKSWARCTTHNHIQSEARILLSSCVTQRTANVLLDQWSGALDDEFTRISSFLDNGEHEEALRRIVVLRKYTGVGLHLTKPWKVIFTGRPNVGKSSLVNGLLGYERSIVHDQPGTTRDLLTTDTVFDGWPLQLIDSAGQHTTDDFLENLGIEIVRRRMDASDLVIIVFDGLQHWSKQDQQIIDDRPDAIVVYNKSDLGTPPAMPRSGIRTSALHGDGMIKLANEIVVRLVPSSPPPGQPVPFTHRHVVAVEQAYRDLKNNHPLAAMSEIAKLLTSNSPNHPV